MNKNRLLALAITVLPVGAFASDVEIYGKLTGAIESTRTTYAGRHLGTTTKVESYDSYIGFKGNEDLGNGLKAIWQVEQSIAIDGSSGQDGWASRETFVGLSGAWGTVQAGYLDNFQRKYSRLDPHKGTGWTGMGFMHGNANSAANTEALVKNALAYTSPEWNGLTARVMYSAAGEGRSINGNTENLYEIGLRYARDGFYGQYAYTRSHNSSRDGTSFPVAPGLGDSPDQERVHYLEAGYEANGWLAAVTYMNRSATQDSYINPSNGSLGDFLSIKSRAIGVNLAYTLGRWTPHFQYQHAWQPSSFFYGSYDDNSGRSWNQYILGVDYALSKRTELQAAAGYVKSGNYAQYNKPYLKGHTVSLGLSHSF
ncbi:porin [Laribacter hongkongensis]|uniref:porin n=1 Tax=Laribacter hongkongensis TaxID=168471 RepID=UPI001EFE4FC2|nr:porin [Laribacter hongkongensis]MCG9058024.1 porin [Laribacter hongkongensis]MCG9084514.1 porin [Laribacter hongkongensis]